MRTILRRRLGSFGLLLVLLGALVAACGSSTRAADQVHILTWKGDVGPVMAHYVERGIDTAERSHARAVVLRLDTPGGLDSSMRKIIQRIEASTVPVIVYVSPSGGRAASAGTFITMAGHVAAMAPNTTIGAATPISSTGGDIEGALGRKVENDAVAYIRGIAELRGRNADWAEQAVRSAVAVSEGTAVSLNVVDFVATGNDDLLSQADGRSVQVADSGGALHAVTLHTAGARTTLDGPTLAEEVLNFLSDPNLAYLLLSLGTLALLSELFHPTIVGGVVGALALIMAYFALGTLPTNWAAVALIMLGFALIIAEVFVAGFGALGVGGVIALVLGGLFLFSGNDAGIQVSRWLVLGIAGLIGAFFLLFVGALVRMRRAPQVGREVLIGARGFVRQRLAPRGVVWVAGERWEAIAEEPPLEEGAPVVVTRYEGLTLTVKRDPSSLLLPAGQVETTA